MSHVSLLPTSQGVDLQAGPLDHILDNLLEWHFFRGRLLLQFLPPHDFGHETLISEVGGEFQNDHYHSEASHGD